MSKRIIFATGNKGKMNEIREIMADFNLPILSMEEAGVYTEAEETGSSFLENSFIKARAVAEKCKDSGYEDIVLADDSGLVVDALNGEPGIYSARYLGEDTSYTIKNNKILERMKDVPEKDRTARFVCAIACILPDGKEISAEARYELTDSATIPSSIFRTESSTVQNSIPRKRTESVTGEELLRE